MTALPTLRNAFAPGGLPRLAVLAGIVAAAAVAQTALAQPGGPGISATPVVQYNGKLIAVPSGPLTASRRSGLRLVVDPRWTNGYGYRPVKVTVHASSPPKSARSLRIRLHVGWNRELSIDQVFELPAGSASASTTISLPIYQTSLNYFWWDVWVDDAYDKDLSLDRVSSLSWAGGGGGPVAGVTLLVLGPPAQSRTLVATNTMDVEVLSLAANEFPTNWLDYTTFDAISLSRTELQGLAQNSPAMLNAMLQWVRSGGQLWISDLGQQWEHLPLASRLVGLSESLYPAADEYHDATDQDPLAQSANAADETPQAGGTTSNTTTATSNTATAPTSAEHAQTTGNPAAPATGAKGPQHQENAETPRQEGWRPLRFLRPRSDGQVITFMDTRTGVRRTIRDPESIAQLQNDPNYVTTNQRFDPAAADVGRSFPGDSGQWFVQQPLGFGVVRAFRGANEAAQFAAMQPLANPNAAANAEGTAELPRALSLAIRRTPRWEARHGLTPDGANIEFARLLVPGVGLAPVTEFRVLITLFVLLIGPLNYWLLKRAKRLHLMVLTVPLAALATTLALFAYAIVADGFDTRLRSHSFTKLNQRTGDATCWARLSYYSGLAPSAGLKMPADIALYPIYPSWAGSSDFFEQRDVLRTANETQLVRGWLSSRTPTQYLSVRARKSPARLEVLDSSDKVRVKNHLGASISYIVLVNGAGQIYEGEAIPPAGPATLRPTTRDDAIRRLNKIVMSNLPQAPEALASGESNLSVMRSRSRFQMYGRYGGPNTGGRLSDNLAGTALIDLIGLGGRLALDLPAKSYVAITDHAPEVETGISYAIEEASFHVIEANW